MRTLTLTDEQAAQLAELLDEVADEREDYARDMSRENEPGAAAENAANADLCRAILVLLANQPT